MSDAQRVVEDQHTELLRLVRQLESQPPISERISGEALRTREQLMTDLRRTFVAQVVVKKRHLWPAIHRSWPDGDRVADQGRELSRAVEELLIKVGWFGDRDAHVNTLISQLIMALGDLVRFERMQLIRLDRTLSGEDLRALGADLRRHRTLPPTRPHPDLPSSAAATAMLAPVMGLVDRAVEMFSFGPSGS